MELEVGQEITGEVRHLSPRGFMFVCIDDSEDEEGKKKDIFVHARDILNKEFEEIELGMKVVLTVAKDNIKPDERFKGENCKILE